MSTYLFSRTPGEVFALRYSLDDEYLACALSNHTIRIYQTKSGAFERELDPKPVLRLPVTTLAFRPAYNDDADRNVLTAGYASGHIIQWHITSGKILASIHEKDNQINCLAYFADGSRFATVGSDSFVRVYDEVTKKLIVSLFSGNRDDTAGTQN